MNVFRLLAVSVVFYVAGVSSFPLRSAELGMPAPQLRIEQWVKGAKVSLNEGKGRQVYVIEFWATWCAPCRTTIPHLTELQKKYQDQNVTIIGISDESPDIIRRFVERMGKDMDYRVCSDDQEQTSGAYMKAFNQTGIPYAFVIDKSGVIVWHGHPTGLDKVLEEVVSGKFNYEDDKRSSHAKALIEQYLELVKQPEKDPKSADLGQEILRDGGKDARLLNEFAWTILTKWSVQQRDIPLALEASQRAVKLTAEKQPAMLDTYAKALFMSGKKDDAIKVQTQAIALCPNERSRAQFEAALEEYKR